ncbi:MAG: hypothetical protein LAO06_12015 [Acidobacteriia bacterium]|nr:hypothetical protein [Terriglobia bacterium]
MTAYAASIGFKPKIKKSTSSKWSVIRPLEETGSWVPEVLEKIEHLAQLPPDWDSYGSARLQPAAIKGACRFLLEAPSNILPIPHVTLVPGGGLGFHWQVENRDLELEFKPTGTVEYLKTTMGGERPVSDEGVIPSLADTPIWNWLVGT